MAKSNIEWTGKVWNFIAGCTLESPGCEHCYAMRMAWRLMHIPMMRGKYEGTARKTAGGKIQWTGKINYDLEALLLPLKWRKPEYIFVNSMSDLFHPSIPFDFIDRVFCIMRAADWHTYQILTKRDLRMREYLTDPRLPARLDACFMAMLNEGINLGSIPCIMQGYERNEIDRPSPEYWPIPNVHIGVSIESEKYMPRLLNLAACPAAVRFVSAEPLLGPLDFAESFGLYEYDEGEYSLKVGARWTGSPDWVIVGAESGQGARPSHPQWVRTIVKQCIAAKVPVFFKQWGNWIAIDKPHDYPGSPPKLAKNERYLNIAGGFGFHGEDVYRMRRVSKKQAGRLLDGVEYLQMPDKK